MAALSAIARRCSWDLRTSKPSTNHDFAKKPEDTSRSLKMETAGSLSTKHLITIIVLHLDVIGITENGSGTAEMTIFWMGDRDRSWYDAATVKLSLMSTGTSFVFFLFPRIELHGLVRSQGYPRESQRNSVVTQTGDSKIVL